VSTALPVADPLLLELPEALIGRRVIVRPYRNGDEAAIAGAVAESRERLLAAAMPWVRQWDDPNQGAIYVRRCQAKWISREELFLGIWERARDMYVGSTGLHRIDWSVPSVEIGYWLRTGCGGAGLVTEATALVAAFAFEALHAQRVRIRCDVANARSAAVARRLGFVHEATLRNECRRADGTLRSTFEFALTPDDFRILCRGAWSELVPAA
jgi:RimJ/RimL family protein N-acetyltransferase